jgi:death on curing protein
VIELALAAPLAGVVDREFYPELPAKAAVLLYSLAKSQACPDGNKRIAVILTEAFLALNGAMLVAGQGELADEVIAAAESDRSDRDTILRELTDWLEPRIAQLTAED